MGAISIASQLTFAFLAGMAFALIRLALTWVFGRLYRGPIVPLVLSVWSRFRGE